MVLERADSLSPVGPGDANPLEHDVASWDKQLAAGGAGSGWAGGVSGADTPLGRASRASSGGRTRLAPGGSMH
jgi:hypothetical protein